jgi:glycosyltransferase involved in cell wall biosynthesis
MRKLVVLPRNCTHLGGTTLSLSLMIRGFERCSTSEQLCVLVQANTLLAEYLQQSGHCSCLQFIQAQNFSQFMQSALGWLNKQPKDWPLLLENYTDRHVLPIITWVSLDLRLSGRPVYHIFRDLALSYNRAGNLARKIAFTCLSPRVLCNSHFTARAINGRLGKVQEILYPPIDELQFNALPPVGSPPKELQPILHSGARLMLMPSRISKPNEPNDKNLRLLIPVLDQLKSLGYHYHGVVIGPDSSPGQTQTRTLCEQAECFGVADRFTILPPTFSIQDYYKYADIVVSLAPREPFGRTIIEAIACGVPVVGSRTGGVGEILHNFAPEWTIDPSDPVAVAKAVVRIAADSNTQEILTKGKRWVEAQCNAEDYARKIMKITGILD